MPCQDNTAFECATIIVPSDYTRADGHSFSIAVTRLPSTAAHPRLLVTNPGGPGISGVADLHSSLEYFRALTDIYTVVSFDPRGVTGSEPAITCLDERQRRAIFDQPSVPSTETQTAQARLLAMGIGQSCQQQYGQALAHVGTDNVVRDMDAIRASMGFETLNYLGFSYGTFVGSTYLRTFPDRTDRMALDSVMDPAVDYQQIRHGQAVGMQNSVTAFVDNCLAASDCPLSGPKDVALQRIYEIVDTLDGAPYVAADGRRLSGARMLALIESSMYFPESGWPNLRRILRHAVDGDLAAVTDSAYSPDLMVNPADSEYLAVVCTDFQTERDPMAPARLAPGWAAESPLSGANRAWSLQPCETWPAPPNRQPAPVSASGAGNVLLLNTTDDPATPLAWAQALHSQLVGSSLVIAPAQGHIAMSQNACADRWLTRFLRTGQTPQEPTYTCVPNG